MNTSTRRSLIAAAVVSAAVSVVFGTPELITDLIMFFLPFVLIFAVLSVLLRLPPIAAWPMARQHVATWLVAAVTGVLVGLLPRVL